MKPSATTSGPCAENTTDVLIALSISSRPIRGPKTSWVGSRRVLLMQNGCIYCRAKFLDDVRSDMCARARNIRSQRMHRMRQRDSCKQISFQQLPKKKMGMHNPNNLRYTDLCLVNKIVHKNRTTSL